MPPIRKYESGYEKRKKKKKLEELTQSQRGALDNFFRKEPQIPVENQNVDNVDVENLKTVVTTENNNMENESVDPENRGEVPIENDNLNTQNVDAENDDNLNNPFEHSFDIFDPRNWDALDSKMIDLLVTKGPKRDLSIVNGPKDKFSRRFTANLYTRVLSNGEKCDRDWLVYSKELDRVFCFCCKVFKRGIGRGQLTNEGFSDWAHIGERLREHETGMEHVKSMTTWYELRQRLQKNQTIDKMNQRLIEKEKDHWKNVLKRIISIVKFLAKHSLAFRGSNERLYQNSNGNFLGLIEMLA